MASTSEYASKPRIGAANFTAALGGTRATPTGASTLITAGASGTLITRAIVQNNQPVGSAAPNGNVAMFYLHDGTSFFLVKEFGFTATNPVAGTASEPFEVPFNDLVLPVGWSLRAGIGVRVSDVDDTVIAAYGADL